jgi:glycosyltransferase involved in cell wall biosynthesis
VLTKIPQAEFVIAGEGGEKASLMQFAEKLGISEKIKFLGKVTEEEKIKLFQKAWDFVNPSYMEGWGITILEANACGTPAVASNVPGLKDAVKDITTGSLIRYGKYNGFSRSIINLIQDNKLRNEMSFNSVEWAKKYSWDESAMSFNNILSEELSKPRTARTNRFAFVLNRLISLL